MPCAWGVYGGDDGKVYITGMNMGLMAKMFGGNIARVMGESVSKDEARMLERVILAEWNKVALLQLFLRQQLAQSLHPVFLIALRKVQKQQENNGIRIL